VLKVVADCNTYISGLLFDRPPSEFIHHAQLERVRLYISTPILDEVLRVLSRKKFGLTNSEITQLKRIIEKTARKIEADPTDNRVIECALECHAP
jgi:putative PIN family toxin of toxin-antitoxin system